MSDYATASAKANGGLELVEGGADPNETVVAAITKANMAAGGVLEKVIGTESGSNDPKLYDPVGVTYASLSAKSGAHNADEVVIFDSNASYATKRTPVSYILSELESGTVISDTDDNVQVEIDLGGNAWFDILDGKLRVIDNYSQSVGGTNADCYIDNAGLIAPNTSSREVKEDIEDAPLADLEKLKLLRPRKYKRKADPDKKDEIGLIAEEVALVFPEAVAYKIEELPRVDGRRQFRVTNTPQGVNYSRLVTPLLGLVQSLITRIETLEGN